MQRSYRVIARVASGLLHSARLRERKPRYLVSTGAEPFWIYESDACNSSTRRVSVRGLVPTGWELSVDNSAAPYYSNNRT
jgi:hypothetical protein